MTASMLIQDLDEALGVQDGDQLPLAVGSTGLKRLKFTTLRTELATTIANTLQSLVGAAQNAATMAGTHAAAAREAAAQSGSSSAIAASASADTAIAAAELATNRATAAQASATSAAAAVSAAIAAAEIASPPEAGIAVSTGDGWGPSKAVPNGALVGTSDTQTLTGKMIDFSENTLVGVAPLASPALTGMPTAPTPAAGTNSTQVANTAFVATAIAALVNSAPGTLDTLNELAAALANDPNFATTMTNALAAKAPLASPSFTGTPTAPTPPSGTDTTQLATTAFARAEALAVPLEIAVSAIGKPGPSQVLARFVATQALTLNQWKCRGSARVAATASAIFVVKKNGSPLGTFTFDAASTSTAVALTSTSIAPGDVLTWEAATTADATLEDIALTLAGSRS